MIKVSEFKTTRGHEGREIFYSSLSDVYEEIQKHKEKLMGPQRVFIFNRNSNNSGFNYFNSFDEALNNLFGGSWKYGTQELNSKFNLFNKAFEEKARPKMNYDVVGFTPSVPRYLQNLPTNMINQKPTPKNEKVITVIKHIGFQADISIDKIIENSAKALTIINQIEKAGIRCNLDVVSPAYESRFDSTIGAIRIRIKKSNEKIAPGKLAFSIANPDMLRRIIFALRVTNQYEDRWNYYTNYPGSTVYDRAENLNMISQTEKGAYFLNNFIESTEEEIKNMLSNIIK